MNGNINACLILVDRVLEDCETGFVRCERCGEQEDTKDLDFVDDIKAIRSELILLQARCRTNQPETQDEHYEAD